VNTAMKLAGFLKGWGGGNFLIRWATISFIKTVVHILIIRKFLFTTTWELLPTLTDVELKYTKWIVYLDVIWYQHCDICTINKSSVYIINILFRFIGYVLVNICNPKLSMDV
jgi:hypothetical protein